MVGTRSLSSGAHSRDPVALPTLRTRRCRRPACPGDPAFQRRSCTTDRPLEYWVPRLKRGMTVEGAQNRILAAQMRPSFSSKPPSSDEEGAGNAGCGLHPWSACSKKSTRQNHRFSRSNRHSLRNGFNGLYVISSVNRACLPPSSARRGTRLCGLDASVGAPGPHDFAVRDTSFVS